MWLKIRAQEWSCSWAGWIRCNFWLSAHARTCFSSFLPAKNGTFSLFALVFLAKQWSFFAFCAGFSREEWNFFAFWAGFKNWSTKLSLFFENIKKAHKVSKSCVLLFVFSTKSDKFLHFLLCLHNQVANISFQNRMIARYSLNHTDGYNSSWDSILDIRHGISNLYDICHGMNAKGLWDGCFDSWKVLSFFL